MKRIISILLLLPLLAARGPQQTRTHRGVVASSAATYYMLTSSPSGTLRNTYAGPVGYIFTANALTPVSQNLCRWNVSGNSQTHTVFLYDQTASSTVASVSINTSLGTPGTWQCVAASYGSLVNGDVYFMASCETSGGDQWYDTEAYTADPTFAQAAYSGFYTFSSYGTSCPGPSAGGISAGQSYVPATLTR